MRIHDITKENQPRERLLRQGVSVLSDAELLAIILQNGCYGENAVDISNRLIACFGVEKLGTLSASELMKIKSTKFHLAMINLGFCVLKNLESRNFECQKE